MFTERKDLLLRLVSVLEREAKEGEGGMLLVVHGPEAMCDGPLMSHLGHGVPLQEERPDYLAVAEWLVCVDLSKPVSPDRVVVLFRASSDKVYEARGREAGWSLAVLLVASGWLSMGHELLGVNMCYPSTSPRQVRLPYEGYFAAVPEFVTDIYHAFDHDPPPKLTTTHGPE